MASLQLPYPSSSWPIPARSFVTACSKMSTLNLEENRTDVIQAKTSGACFFQACVGTQIRPGRGLRRDSSTACTPRSGLDYVEPPPALHPLAAVHRFGVLNSWSTVWKTGQKRVMTLAEHRTEDLVVPTAKAAAKYFVGRSQAINICGGGCSSSN